MREPPVLGAQRGWTNGVAAFFAAPFIWLRVPPNLLTVAGVLASFLPAYLAYRHEFLWAGVLLPLVAGFDLVDGAVARATQRATPFGGYLDSVLDRISDAVILLGIGLAINERLWWAVIGAGLVGQYLTSYARARSYQDARPPPETWNQFFERPERVLFLSLVLLAQGALDRVRPETEVLFWGLVVYAAASLLTAAMRVIRVRRILMQTPK